MLWASLGTCGHLLARLWFVCSCCGGSLVSGDAFGMLSGQFWQAASPLPNDEL